MKNIEDQIHKLRMAASFEITEQISISVSILSHKELFFQVSDQSVHRVGHMALDRIWKQSGRNVIR